MLKRILFAMVLSVALTACGGGEPAPTPAPVTFSQLPVFSGATVSTNPALVAGAAAVADEMKASAKNVEAKAYDVPAGATWDAIKSFYSTDLGKAGWTAGPSGDNNAIWVRTTPIGQGLTIVFVPASSSLFVVLFEQK